MARVRDVDDCLGHDERVSICTQVLAQAGQRMQRKGQRFRWRTGRVERRPTSRQGQPLDPVASVHHLRPLDQIRYLNNSLAVHSLPPFTPCICTGSLSNFI